MCVTIALSRSHEEKSDGKVTLSYAQKGYTILFEGMTYIITDDLRYIYDMIDTWEEPLTMILGCFTSILYKLSLSKYKVFFTKREHNIYLTSIIGDTLWRLQHMLQMDFSQLPWPRPADDIIEVIFSPHIWNRERVQLEESAIKRRMIDEYGMEVEDDSNKILYNALVEYSLSLHNNNNSRKDMVERVCSDCFMYLTKYSNTNKTRKELYDKYTIDDRDKTCFDSIVRHLEHNDNVLVQIGPLHLKGLSNLLEEQGIEYKLHTDI